MTVQSFFAASNVLIIAGKGGVGKTTVGAATAFAAARSGYHALLIELEGYSNLGPSLGLGPLGYEPIEVDLSSVDRWAGAVPGRLRIMQLRPDEALADYLDRAGLGPILRRFTRSDAVEVVVAAAPGIRDLVTLGKIRQMEQARVADLIVVDAHASGHALSFLTSAAGMADSTTGGPIKEQADQVLDLLGDERRCRVLLVTLPEETPVSETVETAFAIEDEVGVKLGPVVVNGLWPAIDGLAEAVEKAGPPAEDGLESGAQGVDGSDAEGDANAGLDQLVTAARYRIDRIADQEAQVARLAADLPLPQIRLPQLFTADLGTDDIARLADALVDELETGSGTGTVPAIGVT